MSYKRLNRGVCLLDHVRRACVIGLGAVETTRRAYLLARRPADVRR